MRIAHIDLLANSIKSYMMREYMAREDILPELQELVRKGTEDNPALDISKEFMVHVTNIMNNIGDWGGAVKLRREKYLEALQSRNPEYAEALTSGNSSSSSSDDTSTDDNAGGDDDNSFFDDEPPGMDDFDEGAPEENAEQDEADTTGEDDMGAEEQPAEPAPAEDNQDATP